MLSVAQGRRYRPRYPRRARRCATLPPAKSAAPPRTRPAPASGNPPPAGPPSPVETDVFDAGPTTCGVAAGDAACVGFGVPDAGVGSEPGRALGVRSLPGPVTTDGRVCCGVGIVGCVGCVGPAPPSPPSALAVPAFGPCCAAWAVAVRCPNCPVVPAAVEAAPPCGPPPSAVP